MAQQLSLTGTERACDHPEVGVNEALIQRSGQPDGMGRESFTAWTYDPAVAGLLEMRSDHPGGPSRPRARCGHTGQRFHAVVSEHVDRFEKRGFSVRMEAT